MEAFYKDRNYAPVWSDGGKVTERARGVMSRLKDAGAEGLNPSDYPTPDFAAATTPDALVEAELKLTESAMDYARHALTAAYIGHASARTFNSLNIRSIQLKC